MTWSGKGPILLITMYVYKLYTYLRAYMCSVSDGHDPPPAIPTDNLTVVLYSNQHYRLNINLTDVPLGISYVVRLITNATNTISYFPVLPVCNIVVFIMYCIGIETGGLGRLQVCNPPNFAMYSQLLLQYVYNKLSSLQLAKTDI